MLLKKRLREPNTLISIQACIIPSAVSVQAISSAGADCVMIDQEHGPIGNETLHAMIASTKGTPCAPLVRVPEISEQYVKRALDAGAEGICFPLVRSASDAERCVQTLHYPPSGRRGWGPFVAHSRWDVPIFEYATGLAHSTVCMLLIETIEAVQNIEEICAVEGLDLVFVAPFDLSTELGISGQLDHPELRRAIERIEDVVLERRIPLGGVGFTREATRKLIERGYRVVGGFDLLWLKQSVTLSKSWLSAT
jgi:4-hydroxy-2-oxoheptanedioate aldolase